MLGHRHPVFTKLPDALPRHQRIGIVRPHHHVGDTCRQNGLGAGRLLAVMTAGFQGHVQGRTPRVLGAGGQRVALRVGLTVTLVPALADDAAVLDDHSPHHGIGRRPATARCSQLQRQMHELLVLHAITSKRKP